jgi:hypothetical protein
MSDLGPMPYDSMTRRASLPSFDKADWSPGGHLEQTIKYLLSNVFQIPGHGEDWKIGGPCPLSER